MYPAEKNTLLILDLIDICIKSFSFNQWGGARVNFFKISTNFLMKVDKMLTGNFSNNMTFGVDFLIIHFKVQNHTFLFCCVIFFLSISDM